MKTFLDLDDKRGALLERLLAEQRLDRRRGTIAPRSDPGPAPLSFGQHRLWFLHQLEREGGAYNITEVVRLLGPLDRRIFAEALVQLQLRHDVLRARFRVVDAEPVQEPSDERPPVTRQVDLTALPEAQRRDEARRLAGSMVHRPFDLEDGPPLRSALLRLGVEDHVLALALHHIVADGPSMQILVRDLISLYGDLLEDRPSTLPPLPVQYGDYAAWQRERLRGETLERLLEFWRDWLEGAPRQVELPTDRPFPAVQSSAGDMVSLALAPQASERLARLVRKEGTTVFSGLLAVLTVLLRHLCRQDDLLIGTPVTLRDRPETRDLIGFFVNTLVLRLDVRGGPTFRELLASARETMVEAREHQELPFERLVESLDLPRDLSRSLLFQVMLAFQREAPPSAAERGLTIRPFRFDARSAQFELVFRLAENDGWIGGEVEYRTALFDRTTALRFARRFEGLVAALVAEPDVPVSRLGAITCAERHQLLHEWNDTAYRLPQPGVTLDRLFARQAAATPEAPVLIFEGRTMSYRELAARAAGVGRHLRRLDCGPGSTVAVALERGPDLVVALLGVLGTGAAYVPLDPEYPAERLEFMLEDAAPVALLTEAAALGSLPDFDGPVVEVGDVPAAHDAGEPEDREDFGLAYAIYTSGSTGWPKGAMVSHAAIRNRLLWMQRAYGLGPRDTVLQKTPMSFDVSVWEFFWPLITGARLVLARPGGHRDPRYLARLVSAEGVTVMHFVPSMLQSFVEEPEAERCRSLRLVVASGEALPADLAERFRDRLEGTALENLYGPTEAAVDVTSWSCRAGETTVPIGRPIDNTRIHVLDPEMEATPIGVPGELCIGGANLGRGYLRRAGLTAERFVPDPFGAPGDRLYRTADLVVPRRDGAVVFLGRLDHQVKLRGFRIELGEIESVLSEHPAVREAVAVVRALGAADAVVAYWVAAPGGASRDEDLRRHLESRLPAHMVPAALVSLEALPLTPSGKVDRRALPEPERETAEDDGAVPEDPVEGVVAAVFEDVLGVVAVGRDDHFFSLGGHSLLATQVVSRLRTALGADLDLRDVFTSPTVRGLAARAAERLVDDVELRPIQPVARPADGLPLSFAQQRLWFLDRLEPGGSAYNIPAAVELEGALRPTALARALGGVVGRHESLRTRFVEVGGEPRQQIDPPGRWTLPWVDLRGLPASARSRELTRLARQEARRPFDLASGGLLRTTLVSMGENRHAVLVTQHHIVSDGWSVGVFLSELAALYRAAVAAHPPPLPELPVQYGDYAVWQRRLLSGERLGELVDHWRERLAGAPPQIELPTDRPRPPVPSSRGGRTGIALGAEVSDRIEALARSRDATPFMVLLAAFALFLRRYSGQRDLTVGIPIAGRDAAEIEELIGFFVNTLVLRHDLSGDPTFTDLLARVRETTLDAYAHQEIPFERLVDELQPERSLARTPLFQVVFMLANGPTRPIELPEVTLRRLPAGDVDVKFDLSLNLTRGDGGYAGTLEYRRDLFDEATVKRFARQLESLATEAVGDPQARLSRISELTPEERRQIVAEWTEVRQQPSPQPLHERFQEVVRRRPDAVAVAAGGERLTYGELDRRANRLAHHLRSLGVAPEDRVALLLGRSVELPVAVLAVLKAGAAYVPVDDQYPPERIAFILDNARVRLLVTDGARPEALSDGFPAERVVALDGDREAIAAHAEDALELPVSARQAAYVIYTSGSTGRPKGVVVEHSQVMRLLTATEDRFGFAEHVGEDCWTLFHSYAFDMSVWEIWGAFAYGGLLQIVPYWVSRSPEAFLDLLERQRVTVLNQTPSAFLQVIAAEGSEPRPLALRQVVFGGEALRLESLDPWIERHGDREPALVNMYGITETTVHVTHRRIRARDLVEAPGSVIGAPMPDLRLYVLHEHLEPVPRGAVGEICVGGDGLARGYFDRPALTAERFVPDPLAAQPGARIYRSGDLARPLAGHDFQYQGRSDHQVKVRGFRIELGEIEIVLDRHPAVEQAVVLVDGAGDDAQLIAYVVTRRELQPSALREALLTRLPDYMVPARFVFLDSMPLTAHGKVDRRALPAAQDTAADKPHAPPRNPTEEAMAKVFAEILGVERVGIDDNFFDLGGDSIRAVRLVGRLNQELEGDVKVQDLFQYQSIEVLAPRLGATDDRLSIAEEHAAGMAEIERMRREILDDSKLRVKLPEDVEDVYPLTEIEKGMIYYSLLLPDEPIYHDQYAYLLSLDAPERFLRAFGLLVDRHSTFRSAFHLSEFPQPMKVVRGAVEVRPEAEDLAGLSDDEKRARIDAYRAADLERRFRFDGELLWRLKLFRLEGNVHCVVWSFYHSLLDGWSNNSLWVELNELYGRNDLEEIDSLPSPPSDYRDYAAISLGRRRDPATEAFWEQALSGYSRNRLPFHRTRANHPDASGMRRLERRERGPLLGALRERARELHVPLRSLCLAAHVYLLHVLSAEDDVVTGAVSHDRPGLVGGDEILGCFLTSVPLRLRIARGATARSLTTRIDRMVRAQKEHEVPLVDVAAMLGVREGGANPIFDTLFNFMDFHVVKRAEENRIFRPMESPELRRGFSFEAAEMTNTLFDLEVSTTYDDLGLRLKYSPRHFDDLDAEQVLDTFVRLLELFAEDLDAPVGAGVLLSEEERNRVLDEYNDTRRPYPTDMPLHREIERRAAADPSATAVLCGDEALSYGDLDRRANRLARHLRSLGVAPGESVGIVFERSPELVVALLAVLKAGGAYVPMEPSYPAARKGHIVDSSGMRLALAETVHEVELPAGASSAAGVSWVLPRQLDLDAFAEDPLPGDPDPHQLAYTIFTSGSTGRPKGVMIEHHSAANLVDWVNREHGVGRGDTLLMVSSVCFDLSVYDLLGGLAAGARVVVARTDDLRDPGDVLRLVREHGITFWNSVPSTLEHLVRYLEAVEPALRQHELRTVFLSGDWIPVELPRRARRFFPNARVISLGGATEGTVWSIHRPVDSVEPDWVSIPYGRPIANNTFYVLDDRLEPVPTEVVGNLYIGGVGVARGYADDRARTAVCYLPDPFTDRPGATFYRTGDLGRMRRTGEIEFLGRVDNQVKIRGFRIELGEIESQLLLHPGLFAGVVLARQGGDGDRYLCAYVVPSRDEPSSAELREHLAKSLPRYMIPTTYVVLEELPLTANGKIDRKALPDPAVETLTTSERYRAPKDEVEEGLVELWSEVLGIERVGTGHDFFELGGHSLSAVQVMTRVRQRWGVELPLRRFFEQPTIAALAGAVESARTAAGPEVPPLEPAEGDPAEGRPLSFSQERLWFMEELQPGNPFYNLVSAVEIDGELEPRTLERALAEVVERHEVLRTRFVERGGEPVQVVEDGCRVVVPVIDLGDLSEEAREREARRLASEISRRPFDLGRSPLLRMAVLDHGGDRRWVVLAMHHVVSDGTSMWILVHELVTLYESLRSGVPSPLRELPIQYSDFAVWQRGWLAGEVLEGEVGYWRRQLAGAPETARLPLDRLRPPVQSFRGGRREIHLPRASAEALRRLAAEEGVTLFVTLLASFQAVLHHHGQEDDLSIGGPVSYRNWAEVENLIGFFVNTLVYRTDLSGDPSFRTLLSRVRRVVLEALGHQHVPFERLVQELQPARSLGHQPLYQVGFTLQPPVDRELEGTDLRVRPVPVDVETTQLDLNLNLGETEDGLVGRLEYASDLFDRATVDLLVEQLARVVERVTESPELCLSEISDELHRLQREHLDEAEGEVESTRRELLQQALGRRRARSASRHGGEEAPPEEADVSEVSR